MSTHSLTVNRWLPVAVVAWVVGVITGILVIALLVGTQPVAFGTGMSDSTQQTLRVEPASVLPAARAADAARYEAVAASYLQRGRNADSTRYTALADPYGVMAARAADAARYEAIAASYLQRGRDADAARYTALGEHY